MADILVNNVSSNMPPVTTPPVVTPTPPTSPVTPPPSDNPDDLDTRWTRWRCLVCNYTYEGRNPLKKCPRCGNENPDKFNDVD